MKKHPLSVIVCELLKGSFPWSFLTGLSSFHPESHGKGWAGTSTKPLVIGHHPSLGSENLLESEAFLSLASVQ
jgi:hypothetical protein